MKSFSNAVFFSQNPPKSVLLKLFDLKMEEGRNNLIGYFLDLYKKLHLVHPIYAQPGNK